jgi:hypothetical protein
MAEEGKDMKRSALFSLAVASTLTLPLTGFAANLTSSDGQERAEQRVYDRSHKDYHVWDAAEDHAYRAWLETRHFTYRELSKLKRSDRDEYWRWRHDHPDGDRDRR